MKSAFARTYTPTILKYAIPIGWIAAGMVIGILSMPDVKPAAKAAECKATSEYDYKPMSNEDIIAETHKCEAAGLKGESLINKEDYGSLITRIQCQPKED